MVTMIINGDNDGDKIGRDFGKRTDGEIVGREEKQGRSICMKINQHAPIQNYVCMHLDLPK